MKRYLLFIILNIASCKKDPVVEIIYPLPYLPVYPGSWWRYLDENNDTITMRTSDDYIEHSYCSSALYGSYTKKVRVPFWDDKPVYGYSSPMLICCEQDPSKSGWERQVGYLSEHTGDKFTTYSYKSSTWREVGTTDTSIMVNGIVYNNVIRVNTWSASAFYHQPQTLGEITYYARDIGLIKDENVADTMTTLQLIDYYINH